MIRVDQGTNSGEIIIRKEYASKTQVERSGLEVYSSLGLGERHQETLNIFEAFTFFISMCQRTA